MLLGFSFANYRSINERCTFSMTGEGISDTPQENYVEIKKNKVLKSAVIYGANSSGKSNVVKAMREMERIVLSSVKLNDNEELDYDPFLFSEGKDEPSLFEVTFIYKDHKYRYGFELNSKLIVAEWLYRSTVSGLTEKELFYRELSVIECNEKLFAEGVPYVKTLNSNRLFVSLCAQLGGKESKKIVSWFQEKFNVISGLSTSGYATYSRIMLHKKLNGSDNAKLFFKRLKLGFTDLEPVEVEFDTSQLPDDMPKDLREKLAKDLANKKSIELFSIHNIYDADGNIIDSLALDVEDIESEGTKKLIELSGPIFDTLNEGKIIIIDELDAKLHPLISQHIIGLFNNPETNPNNAQLIFTTHDTHLLTSKLFRRDQIWFTEKDSKEQTDLYNMMDIKLPNGSVPRNDANYEKNYIAGRYGAIPYILNE